MTTAYKIPGFFTAPATPLEALERERERIQGCADRNAAHYANILRDMDAEIAALTRKNEDVARVTPETAQIATIALHDVPTGGVE